MLDLTVIAKRITELRRARHLSVEAFAEWIGVDSHSTVSDWLNLKRAPSALHLALLGRRCGVTTDWLLGLTDRKHPVQCRTDATLEEDLAAYIAREVCARVAPEHAAWTARFLASDSGGTSPIRVAQILEDEVERVAKTVRDMQAVLRQVAQFYKQARRLTSAAKVSRPSERHHALAALADHTRSNYPTVAPFIGLLEGGNTLGLPVQIGSDGTLRVDMRETGLPLPELRVKLKG